MDTLEALLLVQRSTRLGVPVVELRNEDGYGWAYSKPAARGHRYIRIPIGYWRTGFDRQLDLSSKAVLLIALSLKPEGFTLPLANAEAWYGISSDTLRRGIKGLLKAEVAKYQSYRVVAPQAPEGFTIRRMYKLSGALSRDSTTRPLDPRVLTLFDEASYLDLEPLWADWGDIPS